MNRDISVASYIKPSLKIKLGAFISIVLMGISIFGIVYFESMYKLPEPTAFSASSKEGDYCYSDIQLLTNWVLRDEYNTYYAARDVNGNEFTIILTDSDFEEYKALYDYNSDTSPDAIAPEPVRITGTVIELGSEEAEVAGKYFHYFSAQQYYDNFGKLVINTAATPVSHWCEAFVVAMVLCLFSFIIFFSLWLQYAVNYRKSIKYLARNDSQQTAEYEINQSEEYIFNKCGIVLTKNFMFIKGKGIAIRYTDVMWLYKKFTYYNGIRSSTSLVLVTVPHNKVVITLLFFSNKHGFTVDELIRIVSEKNPEGLYGFNKAYAKQVKLKRKDLLKLK